MRSIEDILADFLEKEDFSAKSAKILEGQLDANSEDDVVEDLLDVLASYRPGGGEFLYNKEDLEKQIRSALAALKRRGTA